MITPGLGKFQPSPDSQAEISAEHVDVIDADVIVFATESRTSFDALQSWSTIGRLDAVRRNRAIYAGALLSAAIYFPTPLSLRFLLAELVPLLDAALEGQAPRRFPA